MTSAAPWRRGAMSPRRELVAVMLLGAAGAGLVFLAMRQGWAQVRTAVPAPLPASVVTDSGQSLIPYADALAIAVLASLAAVLATRRAARRVAGLVLAGLGAGIAAAAVTGVSAAAALAAAAGNASTGTGNGTAAGSVTGGSSPGGSPTAPDVAGFHSHAVLTAATWQAMAVIGALAIIAAGLLVAWRANRLPIMSSRYDSPAGPTPAGPGSARPLHPDPHQSASASADGPAATGSAAGMWEALSRGEDPTSADRRA